MGTALTDVPWVALSILLPLAAGMTGFVWPQGARLLGFLTSLANVLLICGLGVNVAHQGPYLHAVAGWSAPLGIDLYADGLSLWMLAATALVGLGISIYSTTYFEGEQSARFWPLWLFLLAALNALFLSADIFNLYVTLELLGLGSVALTALSGGREALIGAMRYLLANLLASLTYLFGVALLYHAFGSLDIAILSERVQSIPSVWAALALMGAGLLLKTALFPLHFWLPPAHASAPAPVSALLSGLVVKASFYILLRLWLTVFGPLDPDITPLLGLLGAAAILWGSVQALRQTRLKLLIAYSTVAQIGYLFLAFPLAVAGGVSVWRAAVYLALSHALAKAAIFLSAGNLMHLGGHDRIAGLDRLLQRLPLTAGALALAAVSIMGLPPSGGFIGKWLLLEAAVAQRQWGLAVVMVVGGLLAAAYMFKVLGHAFPQTAHAHAPASVPARMQWIPFLLAVGAIVLGFVAPALLPLIDIGTPFGAGRMGP
jgi:multicomponent Na+:H+ antiporter subunit D